MKPNAEYLNPPIRIFPMNKKRCKHCNKLFRPERNFVKCCSYECTIDYVSNKDNLKELITDGKKIQKKQATKRKTEFKQSDKSHLKQVAQKTVNEYVRLRDKDLPCISCGHDFKNGRQMHCGHFRPMGNNQQLRYYTLNTFGQCSICNNHLSGNLIPYRENLIKKLGLEKVEQIESNNTTKKYDTLYLNKLIKVFKKKIKFVTKRNNHTK